MKARINVWKLIPAGIEGLKAGTAGLELATSEESDGGVEVTREEAEKIAKDIGEAVAKRILRDVFDTREVA